MTVGLLITLVVVLLLVLLAIRMPVALALALSGITGLYFLRGDAEYVTNQLGSIPFTQTNSFSLTIVPMFILMGVFAVRARIAEQVYAVARLASRRLPGGLAVATVMACAGFAAVSGSSIGTAATMSRLSVGEMRKAGYPASFAGATVAVAGTLGVLIPPSLFLVLYAIITRESVGAMLASGIIPGILSACAYIAYILVVARKNKEKWAALAQGERQSGFAADVQGDPQDVLELHGIAKREAQAATETLEPVEYMRMNADELRMRDLPLRGVVRVGILFLIVLGGLYSGLFTATESAAMGALTAAIMLVWEFRRDGVKAVTSNVVEALKETAGTTSMVFAIVVGSGILSAFFISARLPQMVTDWASGLGLNPYLTLGALLLLLVPSAWPLTHYRFSSSQCHSSTR
ncbi:TRAP transporter large permease [Blastococcus brunescens]|uniref:TRAP transporter large permease subunit n=1 Tax=Blastococcus brunescens TaxID=1564165 RepID=A0ABZ1B3N4_9ACTN|nr:TRAP transporter large permease subunit [Blastococcus sp. BMG 8361]WRL65415.1 TRAP transporter large permease subunit [Blastococcus sp. BMG 8361]